MVKFDKGVVRPKPTAHFVARDDLPGVHKQRREDLEGLLLESNLPPILAQFSRPKIDLKKTEPYDGAGLVNRGH